MRIERHKPSKISAGWLARPTTVYTLDNLVAAMIAVNSTTGDQITIWTYGTTLADSGVARKAVNVTSVFVGG